MKDFARQLAHALNVEYCETVHPSPEVVIHKAEELVQEANRLRAKTTNAEAQFASVQVDLRSCRDALDRAVADKEQFQRQVSSYLIELDRLKQVCATRPENRRRTELPESSVNHLTLDAGQRVPGDAAQSRGEGAERSEGQAREREQKYNERDREHIESRGADLSIERCSIVTGRGVE